MGTRGWELEEEEASVTTPLDSLREMVRVKEDSMRTDFQRLREEDSRGESWEKFEKRPSVGKQQLGESYDFPREST